MKKLVLVLLALVTIFFVATFAFIPSALKVSTSAIVHCPQPAVERYLFNEQNWQFWASENPELHLIKPGYLQIAQSEYTLKEKILGGINVQMKDAKLGVLNTQILLLPARLDTTVVKWGFELECNLNPLSRIQLYLNAKKIKQQQEWALKAMQTFFNHTEKVYKSPITQQDVTDTLLISSNQTTANYPTTEQVYTLVNQLEKTANANHVKMRSAPMLHIRKTDSTHYNFMVAISVDKAPTPSNNIYIKRMVPGKILVTEIKGNQEKINQGFAEMQHYISDYQRTMPAIPFEMMVTNRQTTAADQWITKIYYPVLE